jgi:hypothetical protein
VAAGLLKDKKCTAYTALEPDVKIAGGHWEGSCPVDGAVVDGNLVTAVAWPGTTIHIIRIFFCIFFFFISIIIIISLMMEST